ncbi:MAG: hypothetical protein GY845_09260 [Planctomycetes bacterium]|nr:hypothetical protein [Planctomycetota bacterium]
MALRGVVSFYNGQRSGRGIPQTSVTYDPSQLEPGRIYYWRVDESDGVDTYKGDIWSFTISIQDIR